MLSLPFAAPAVGLNQPTPFIGLYERINVGVFLLWVVVLALKLMPQKAAAN